MLYVLDSTVLIDHLRGRPVADRIEARLRAGDDLATTAINVEEIARGVRPSERRLVVGFLRGLLVLPIGQDEGWRAGEWRREFAARGVTLSQADCLIAAATATHEAVLATGNPGDFPMKAVRVEHWPVGR